MKIAVSVLAVLLAFSSASLIQPRNLADEAKEQLEQLMSIVRGNIMVAHNDLDSLVTELQINQLNVRNEAGLSIDQLRQKAVAQLNEIKNLAHAAGFNVNSCTIVPEQTLSRLPSGYAYRISECVQDIDVQAIRTATNAKYVVDIVMNKVHELENQLRRCEDNLLCISPVLNDIELNKIRMPQNIKTEVEVTESAFTGLELSIEGCADTNIADFVTQTSTILAEVQECVDKIIG